MSKIILLILLFFILSCQTSSHATDANKAYLRMKLGVSYLEKNDLPNALKELLEAEKLEPQNDLVHNNLGLVYFLRKKFDLSTKHFLKATQLNPKFTDAKNNLARVYIETKQFKLAEKALDEVLDDLTYTNVSAAYLNYGLMRFNQKRFNDSKTMFRKVLESSREDCYANIYYGRSFLELKELNEAAEQLDKAAVYCKPFNIDEGHYYSAIAYFRLGQKNKALVRFEEIIQGYEQSYNKENAKKMIELIKKGVQ